MGNWVNVQTSLGYFCSVQPAPRRSQTHETTKAIHVSRSTCGRTCTISLSLAYMWAWGVTESTRANASNTPSFNSIKLASRVLRARETQLGLTWRIYLRHHLFSSAALFGIPSRTFLLLLFFICFKKEIITFMIFWYE